MPDPSHSSQAASISRAGPTSAPKDSTWVTDCLKSHGLFQDDLRTNMPPAFKRLIQDILATKRPSEPSAASVEIFQKLYGRYAFTNEATILHHIWPFMQKDLRSVPKKSIANEALSRPDVVGQNVNHNTTSSETLSYSKDYDEFEFHDDGLIVIRDQEFRRTMLPNSYADKELERAMRKSDGMTNPKPDITYALVPSRFPTLEHTPLSVETRLLLEVAKFGVHAFFLVEGKIDGGSTGQAQNQACRGGATLVNAARQLRARAGLASNAIGPDDTTFVFSATLLPGLINFWVHWADVKAKDKIAFNMTRLETIAFMASDALGQLRRIIHNILDWGCITRTTDLENLHERLLQFEAAKIARTQEENRKKRKVSSSGLRSEYFGS